MTTGVGSTPPAGEHQRSRLKHGPAQLFARGLGFERFSGLYIGGTLILVFGLWVPDTFLTVATLKTVATQQAITAILALALLLPMAAGAFDLSVGHMMGFALVLVCWFQSAYAMNPVFAVVLALAVGAIVGVVNAIVVVRFRVNSFIATLGMSSVLNAMIFYVTDGQQVTVGISRRFTDFGRYQFYGIPSPVLFLVGLSIVIWFITEYRPLGRKLYATGGNPTAAKLSGIRTSRLVLASLIASGVIAATAGIIFGAQIGSASLSAGPPFLLPAFAAVFLGSTQIVNGRANVLGTLVAVYVLAIGVQGLLLVGVPLWVSDLFNGAALILAVALSVGRGRKVTSGSI